MAYTLKIKDGIEWKTVKQVNYITTHDYHVDSPMCIWYENEDIHECYNCMGNPDREYWDGYAIIEFSAPLVDGEIQSKIWWKYEFIDYDDTNYGGQGWVEEQAQNPFVYVYGQESISNPGIPMPCVVEFAAVIPNHFPGEQGYSSSIETFTFYPHYHTECPPQCSDWADRGYQSYEDCMCTECNEQCS